MERSRLPLVSLLSLFGVLLMLFPEPLLGKREKFSDLPVTDPELQKVLALAMDDYNRDRRGNLNYFKVLRIGKAESREKARDEYHVSADLVETTCKPQKPLVFNYETIQACEELPGTQEKPVCYFKVTRSPPLYKMVLDATICS